MKNNALFATREEAARVLAKRLAHHHNSPETVVLALPGGGVEVGHAIASHLQLPFDILVVAHIDGPPRCGRPIGAITGGGVRCLDFCLIDRMELADAEVRAAIRLAAEWVNRRERFYRDGHAALNVADHAVIPADDGSARCETVRHAIRLLHRCHADRVILATAAACHQVVSDLSLEADEVVCLAEPARPQPPGAVFRHSPRTSSARVRHLLHAGV